MKKAKPEKRFEKLYTDMFGMGEWATVLRDKKTGAQYLFYKYVSAGGLTPLLDKDGNPVIDEDSTK
ncbi:MAG: DUF6440 family protein [Oscillospiraceae bacterium]|nr:DUF6440 family protein [Oscillospiraceae bacterium]